MLRKNAVLNYCPDLNSHRVFDIKVLSKSGVIKRKSP
jgi:hypothetical protein